MKKYITYLLSLIVLGSQVLGLKLGWIYYPDFIFSFFALMAFLKIKAGNLITKPIGFLMVAFLISVFAFAISDSFKPFWCYHIIRCLIVYFCGVYIGFLLEGKGHLKIIFLISFIPLLLTALTSYVPNMLPFEIPKFSSFLAPGGSIESHLSAIWRNSGIYGSYQENGNVMIVPSIAALALSMITREWRRSIIWVMVSVLFIWGVYLTSVRTQIVGYIAAGIAMSSFAALALSNSKYLKSFAGIVIIISMTYIVVAPFVTDEIESIRIAFIKTGLSSIWLGESSGESSLYYTMHQIYFPQNYITMLIGDGKTPWLDGVSSDIACIQFIWGTGVIGLLSIIYFYGSVLLEACREIVRTEGAMPLFVLGLVVCFLIMSIKGQFLIGIRSGDYVFLFAGIMYGNKVKRQTMRPNS